MNVFCLNNRLALVTGSSAGIGEALAHGLCEAGAHVVINGRRTDAIARVVAELQAAGHTAHAMAFDVTDPAAVKSAIDRIEADIGPIEILINNAGIQRRQTLEAFEEETWRELMSTNLDSAFYVAKRVANHMIPRRRGSIINICSVQSELGRPSIAPYAASKGGLKMLTKGMAIDWGPHGIRVNGLGPGYFATELNKALVADETFSQWLCDRTPLGRWGEVGELTGAAVFLASDASSFVTGHVLYVDGGVTARL
ncbi:MAG: glucose 1-dehydrogenase [Alphaproteobacteria bacterium]|nr:glucose 1-dehydrogenase [Alphaproteobacteria bacterium]